MIDFSSNFLKNGNIWFIKVVKFCKKCVMSNQKLPSIVTMIPGLVLKTPYLLMMMISVNLAGFMKNLTIQLIKIKRS